MDRKEFLSTVALMLAGKELALYCESNETNEQ